MSNGRHCWPGSAGKSAGGRRRPAPARGGVGGRVGVVGVAPSGAARARWRPARGGRSSRTTGGPCPGARSAPGEDASHQHRQQQGRAAVHARGLLAGLAVGREDGVPRDETPGARPRPESPDRTRISTLARRPIFPQVQCRRGRRRAGFRLRRAPGRSSAESRPPPTRAPGALAFPAAPAGGPSRPGPARRNPRRTATMECLGPRCAAMLLDWLKARADPGGGPPAPPRPPGAAQPPRGRRRCSAPRPTRRTRRRSARRPSWPGRSSTWSTPSSGGTRTS